MTRLALLAVLASSCATSTAQRQAAPFAAPTAFVGCWQRASFAPAEPTSTPPPARVELTDVYLPRVSSILNEPAFALRDDADAYWHVDEYDGVMLAWTRADGGTEARLARDGDALRGAVVDFTAYGARTARGDVVYARCR